MRKCLRPIKAGKRLLLFLDYDGTLVPIRRTPERAVLGERKKRLLKALSDQAFVCIVSGRSLADIRERVGVEGLAYIGNHGLEISFGRRIWIHPLAKKRSAALKRLLRRIEDQTRRFPKLLIEDKNITASVHFRRMDRVLTAPLKRIVEQTVRQKSREFIVSEGKKVIEILPRLAWDKGKGIRKAMSWLPKGKPALPIFIGDDRTDEDAFRELGGDAMTIHVGTARGTSARLSIEDVKGVWRFLADCRRSSAARGFLLEKFSERSVEAPKSGKI